ncbi:Maltoporin precursor [Vibrio aerogenes CECT 7868]|uniref:Maltoporin n=1 Tax=Vibrio aerogenes CECT 7868 TaxID=1216006 RepID=A0A1M5ZLH2_9VIBR|nr:maltoporin LamB [Vibrio aerogenes]SHI25011.1 Maltoporin precursor [Vibrio aerogenes CECT 7868]
MKFQKKNLFLALSVAFAVTPAHAVDFNGYVRAGIAANADGGGLKGGDEFNKSKLGRLGNEFDNYAEIGLGQELFNDDGHSMYLDTMFSMESSGSMNNETTSRSNSEEATFGIKQAALKVKGYIPSAPEATIWAGKRFYQRQDLHIIDTKYLNISGYGAGVEGVNAGPGTVSGAIVRGDGEAWDDSVSIGDLNIYYADFRYSNLKPWEGSWAEIAVDYAIVNPSDAQKETGAEVAELDNGLMLTAQVSQNFSWGWDKVVLQYGDKGLAQNMISQGGGWYDIWSGDVNHAKGYRLINTGDINLSDNFMIDHVLTYGYAKDHGDWVDDENLLSFVLRPAYTWSQYSKTMLELGYFKSKKTWDGGHEDKSAGKKITLAQALTVGKSFFSRPELRFYISYLKDDEGKSLNNGTDNSGVNYGVQFEAWW